MALAAGFEKGSLRKISAGSFSAPLWDTKSIESAFSSWFHSLLLDFRKLPLELQRAGDAWIGGPDFPEDFPPLLV